MSTTSTIQKLEDNSEACVRHPWVPLLARFLQEGRTSPDPLQAALPLLLVVYLLANRRSGRVLVTRQTLAEVLNVETKAVGSQLHQLERSGQIIVRSDGSHLVLFVRSWPSRRQASGASDPRSDGDTADTALQGSAAEKSRRNSADAERQDGAGAEQSAGDGVRGPESGEEGWLDAFVDRLVTAIGNPHERTAYRTFCRDYPREVLERALSRVERTPAERIRRSRGALFTYLVKTFSNESKR